MRLLLNNIYFFASLLLLYFGEVEKFKVILKAKPAISRLVRMCFAQPGYGPGLLYCPNKCCTKFYFDSIFIQVYQYQTLFLNSFI